jgi:ribonuclease HII
VYLGVDEAGKGPVLGPMAAAAVLADPSDLPADVDDSTRLSSKRRESIDAAIRGADAVGVGVAFVEPAEIDRPDTDMNTLTVRGQARAVRAAVGGGVDIDEPIRVVADAGDTSEARFARRLGEFIADPGSEIDAPPAVDVSAAHGADEDDPLVGAASVVAKVARDGRMTDIDADYPAYDGVGSGYPSDPTTRSFLRAYVDDHGTVPDCARRSWATCDDVLAAAEQSGLDEF